MRYRLEGLVTFRVQDLMLRGPEFHSVLLGATVFLAEFLPLVETLTVTPKTLLRSVLNLIFRGQVSAHCYDHFYSH